MWVRKRDRGWGREIRNNERGSAGGVRGEGRG